MGQTFMSHLEKILEKVWQEWLIVFCCFIFIWQRG